MHNITKKDYLRDPCNTCSTAFWKNAVYKVPDGIHIVHESDLDLHDITNYNIEQYFRLMHNLKEIGSCNLPDGYYFQNVDMQTQIADVAELINRCYDDIGTTPKQVESWTKLDVFNNDLWIFVYEKATGQPVALGIADFDSNVSEGSLEWIQALPEQQGKGLGQAIVNELLSRLVKKANFATVSGKVDNVTKPEMLYRKCGFYGEDIWNVLIPK